MRTAEDVARWMLRELCAYGMLPQKAAALEIRDRFGERFLSPKRRGALAIAPEVLAAFRQFSERMVVWDPRKRYWRLRDGDPPGRRLAGR